MRLHVALLAVLSLCLSACHKPADTALTRTVTGGQVQGSEKDGVRTWFGIPYAAAPTGALRWKAPQPVIPWQGVKQTTQFSKVCRQTVPWISEPQSEDCLFLNVWAPADAKNLPAMVWIHGGGFFGGSGSQGNYNGVPLTKKGVILVTLNYRLGVFGFLSTPELSAESPTKTSGNLGIQDQIAALTWVKANIAAFGGDPARVTIFGESAGSNSIAILTVSPLAKGLFQRAIAESGNFSLPLDPGENHNFDHATAQAQGEAFMHAVDAHSLADLRALDADKLLATPWAPRVTLDGYVLREDMTTTYRNHRQNDVPILVGWNADEGKDLAPEILATPAADFTAARHKALLTSLFQHAPSPTLLAIYPGATDAQAQASIAKATSDYWGWRMWRWTQLQSQARSAKPYLYYFVHWPTEPATPCGYGCKAGHGAEIPYVFNELDQDARPWSPEDRKLADDISTYWTNFAKTGDPNGPGLAPWPAFDGSDPSVFRIGNANEVQQRGAIPDFAAFALLQGQ